MICLLTSLKDCRKSKLCGELALLNVTIEARQRGLSVVG